MLEVADVGKRFYDGDMVRWVLQNMTFTIVAGGTTALWGPSGSGKSTLLNMLAGILVPDVGAVRFHEPDSGPLVVSTAPERLRVRFRRRHVGFVFQLFNLVPTLTVAENVLLPLELNGLLHRREQALARLDALGVGERRERFPAALSGGEQQRVAIARALAHEPLLVLADEPTGNLDRGNAAAVADLLWREVADAGSALVVATHNERLAQRADTLIELA